MKWLYTCTKVNRFTNVNGIESFGNLFTVLLRLFFSRSLILRFAYDTVCVDLVDHFRNEANTKFQNHRQYISYTHTHTSEFNESAVDLSTVLKPSTTDKNSVALYLFVILIFILLYLYASFVGLSAPSNNTIIALVTKMILYAI